MSESIFLETWSSDNVPEAWRSAGRKDLDAIFAGAHESLMRLNVNPLCTPDHAQRLVREDATAILAALKAAVIEHLNEPTDYLKPEGE